MIWAAQVGQLERIPPERTRQRAQAIIREIKDKIYLARKGALKYAVLQMIAWFSFREIASTEPLDSEVAILGTTLRLCPWLGSGGKGELRKLIYL